MLYFLQPGCVGVFAVMSGRMLFSIVFAITEKRAMGMYEVPMSISLLSFWMVPILVNLHMRGIMLVLRAVFNMLVSNANPRGPMCVRCLMFICVSSIVLFMFLYVGSYLII